MVQPVRLRHPPPDAGIEKIEEEQSGDAFRRGARHRLHQPAADIVADNAGLREAERVHQRQHIRGVLVGTVRPVGLVAVAETAQVGRIKREAIGEPRHHRLPGQPEFGPAMQQ